MCDITFRYEIKHFRPFGTKMNQGYKLAVILEVGGKERKLAFAKQYVKLDEESYCELEYRGETYQFIALWNSGNPQVYKRSDAPIKVVDV